MKVSKKELLDIAFRLFVTITTNIVVSIATVWFLEPAALYAGGATGLAQLIFRLINHLGGSLNGNLLGWFILAVNVPIVLVGFKYVSKKFTIYSILAVLIQTVIVLVIPKSPFESLANEIQYTLADGTIKTMMNYGGILTLAIFGGLVAGLSSGIALRFGVSTGGLDVLGQALALKKGISIGNFTMALNVIIACIGGGWLQGSWIIVLFTIVRMILNSLVVDKIHTAYGYTALHIFSTNGQLIADKLMTEIHRGCTLINVEGAHSKSQFEEAYCVVSSYEVQACLKLIKKIDPHAFITLSPVKKVNGEFKKKTIV